MKKTIAFLIVLAAFFSFRSLPVTGDPASDEEKSQARISETKEMLDAVEKLDPKDPRAVFFKGSKLFSEGKTKEARQEWQTCLSLAQPEERGKIIEVISEMTQMPRSPEEKDLIGKAFDLIEKGNLPEAIGNLQEAIRLNPENWRLFYELGYAHVEQHDFGKAIAAFTRGREVNPWSRKILGELKYCYNQTKQWDLTEKLIREELANGEVSPGLFAELSYLFVGQNKLDEGLTALEACVKSFPTFLPAYKMQAEILLRKETLTAAEKSRATGLLRDFIARLPNSTEDWKIKGYDKEGELKSAHSMLEKLEQK